jgi:hypothetical protein
VFEGGSDTTLNKLGTAHLLKKLKTGILNPPPGQFRGLYLS